MMEPEPIDILELPDVLLERILYTCDIRTIATAAAVCKALQRVAGCESLWLKLCQREFVNTDPTRWHSPPRVDHLQSEGSLSDYRSIYRLLSSYEPLIGLWRHSKAERGLLLELFWDTDCIAGTQLLYTDMWANPERSPFSSIGPDRRTVPEPVGSKQLVIRKFAASHVRPPSRAAESAAAVACFGSSPPSETLFGTSPAGSFEHEMLRFMQSNVAGSRQGRRRSKGLPSPGGVKARAVDVLHLERVSRPAPSKRHPMAGLWKANYGPGGIQIVLINYDFTGPAARIVAIKVTGDDHVPAGKHTWHAEAAPMKLPWATAEAALVDMQGQLLQQQAGGLEEAMEANRRVVRIYEGKGKVAALAYTEPQWIEGRLWEYSDGSCGFVWLDRLFDFVLVQFERIDADLRPSC